MKLPFDVTTTAGRRFINLGPDIATAILRTVEVGWEFASQSRDVNAKAGEVEITERLRDGMRRALGLKGMRWCKKMAVLPGTESRSRPDMFVPDGRTDIPILSIEIFLRFGEHDPHAIIECKRIDGNSGYLCREYVAEGIDRFRTGKYSGNHSAGFMVGYLLAGDEHMAVTGINRILTRKSRTNENLKPSDLIVESWAWGSCHPRDGASPIALHHAFLAFAPA